MRELLQEELQAVCPPGIELDKEIGKGSYGRVYSLKGRKEVLKVLDPAMSRPGKTLEPQDYVQFSRELDYACKITHLKNPNLLPVLGVYSCAIQPGGDEKRMIFMMIMPLRRSLEELGGMLSQAGAKPDEDIAIRIVSDLCHGLESLHQDQVHIDGKDSANARIVIPGPLIHGDIKPGNVFVHNHDGMCDYQLGDFGACFRCGNGWIPGQKLYTNFHYTAPEIHDKDIGPGYDVFSLGFMLYWWMNGWQDPVEARKARFQADFEQNFRLENMSPELWQVFMKATQEAPENRYATAAQLRGALENARNARNERIREKEKKAAKLEGIKLTLLTEIKIGAAVAVAALGYQMIAHLAGAGLFIPGISFMGKTNMFSNVTQKLKRNGDLQLENGLVYKGELHNGAAEGAGSLHFPDGGVFTGKWKAGAIDESAKGVYTFANGRTLRGSWRYIDEEDSYTGLLLNGKCAGWGRARFKIGGSYCGEFMDGMPFGKGSYTACDGSVFTGNWKYAAEENGYEGMLMDGRRCGQGIENLPDGSVYVGEFRNGRPAGRKASL